MYASNQGPRRKSQSDSRRNSNGVQGSESGGSGSDNNVSDDLSKVTASLDNINIGDNENESKPTVQTTTTNNDALSTTSQGQQEVEEWEKSADGEESQRGEVTPKNENRGAFKKGHKKSKSSKIEFNFDPDAFEGSTRILDIFDFPASFKTHHLHEIFQEYESMRGGYRIKWMDDTRALIIFEHPVTAYLDNVTNQLATIKPYDGPTDFLQKNPNNAQPRARPATTDMVAKRLVHGALGVRTIRSPEQRQADNQVLRNARDQKDQQRRNETKRTQDVDSAFNE
ncbi:10221_t:CDS:2 [Funneliformis geosporum]|uniref:19447_t:CDS:1 n=1 Tax=Funneliformis geosporum TaxID=1117311 RepID=A0A9W4T4P1_9GLOM|nr:19447_t:CDS:2 [Funneliformis geosporum]CAI2190895.1 10221_t:CDS:2 [Funneliformis geosporum]